MEELSITLYNKVKAEYDIFIAEIKQSQVDIIIESAYEIVSKDNITTYCLECTPNLTAEQYTALINSPNTLNEVYEQWCSNGELHSFDDIEISLKETADSILIAINRQVSDENFEEMEP